MATEWYKNYYLNQKIIFKTSFNQKEKYVPDEKLEHGATFPEKLIKPFILSTSKENDLILDPFMGSGTTAKLSLENGRKCIGYESVHKLGIFNAWFYFYTRSYIYTPRLYSSDG